MALYHLQVQCLIIIDYNDAETDNIDFRAVFSSKAETEEHVGVSHVLGNLS